MKVSHQKIWVMVKTLEQLNWSGSETHRISSALTALAKVDASKLEAVERHLRTCNFDWDDKGKRFEGDGSVHKLLLSTISLCKDLGAPDDVSLFSWGESAAPKRMSRSEQHEVFVRALSGKED